MRTEKYYELLLETTDGRLVWPHCPNSIHLNLIMERAKSIVSKDNYRCAKIYVKYMPGHYYGRCIKNFIKNK
jgi:hypothetical protein